jgi:hypothetical protein
VPRFESFELLGCERGACQDVLQCVQGAVVGRVLGPSELASPQFELSESDVEVAASGANEGGQHYFVTVDYFTDLGERKTDHAESENTPDASCVVWSVSPMTARGARSGDEAHRVVVAQCAHAGPDGVGQFSDGQGLDWLLHASTVGPDIRGGASRSLTPREGRSAPRSESAPTSNSGVKYEAALNVAGTTHPGASRRWDPTPSTLYKGASSARLSGRIDTASAIGVGYVDAVPGE